MRRRNLSYLCFWLLPILVARALIPSGFMLSFEGGSPQLVVCSGAGPVAAAHANGDSHAHHHSANGEAPAHSGGSSHEHAVCPFALAGAAWLASTGIALAPHIQRPLASPAPRALRAPVAQLISAHRIRGPPGSLSTPV